MKAIYCKWKDACSYDMQDHNKTDFDNVHARSVVQDSVGWLLKDDKEGVVMTRDLRTTEGLVSNTLCVPKAYIIKKRTWTVNTD
jgi:hypothetical protein